MPARGQGYVAPAAGHPQLRVGTQRARTPCPCSAQTELIYGPAKARGDVGLFLSFPHPGQVGAPAAFSTALFHQGRVPRWHWCWCFFSITFLNSPVCVGGPRHSFPCFLPVYSALFSPPFFLFFFSIHNLRGSPVLEFDSGAFIYLIYLNRDFYKFWKGF